MSLLFEALAHNYTAHNPPTGRQSRPPEAAVFNWYSAPTFVAMFPLLAPGGAAAQILELRVVMADSAFASKEWVVQHEFAKLANLPGWMAPVVVAMGSLQTGVDA